MQKNVIISIIILILSCTYLPDSIGKLNEIIVIASPEDKVLIEPLVFDIFSQIIYTPQREREFKLNFRNPWDLESYDSHGNIIIVSLDYPIDSTADILAKRILDTHNQDAKIIALEDLYAKNQLFCIIHALDVIDFENILNTNHKWILNEYQTLFHSKIKHEVFKNGKNNDLSERILQMLGHTIDLQPDFKLIRSDSLNSFVWVGRGLPYRWITIHKSRKDKYINIESSWNELKKDFTKFIPEITISNYYQINQNISHGSKKIPVMRGIYEHSESDSGGPFFVYIFDTEQMNELILISGFVNHPGHEKLLLLKQLEIMAITLHKGEPA